MSFPDRPIAFILASSSHGTMIVNRNDYNVTSSGGAYGVGHQILQQSSFDAPEVGFALGLLNRRRQYFGDGVLRSMAAPTSAYIRSNGRGICMAGDGY